MFSHNSEWSVVASATNSTATATKAAPSTKKSLRHYITAVSFSASAAPGAAATLQIRENAATVKWQLELPAAATAPVHVNFVRPLRCSEDVSCDATVGALGAGVVGTVCISGYTATS